MDPIRCVRKTMKSAQILYMHGGHQKESSTQHQTSIYPVASNTLTLVMPSKLLAIGTWFPLIIIFSGKRLRNRRKMFIDPTLHIFWKQKTKIWNNSQHKIHNRTKKLNSIIITCKSVIYPASCLVLLLDASFKLSYIWTRVATPHV